MRNEGLFRKAAMVAQRQRLAGAVALKPSSVLVLLSGVFLIAVCCLTAIAWAAEVPVYAVVDCRISDENGKSFVIPAETAPSTVGRAVAWVVPADGVPIARLAPPPHDLSRAALDPNQAALIRASGRCSMAYEVHDKPFRLAIKHLLPHGEVDS